MSEAGQRTVAQIAAEADGLRARGFCHGCVPAVPVCEAACVCCATGPLLAGVDPVGDPAVAVVERGEGW